MDGVVAAAEKWATIYSWSLLKDQGVEIATWRDTTLEVAAASNLENDQRGTRQAQANMVAANKVLPSKLQANLVAANKEVHEMVVANKVLAKELANTDVHEMVLANKVLAKELANMEVHEMVLTNKVLAKELANMEVHEMVLANQDVPEGEVANEVWPVLNLRRRHLSGTMKRRGTRVRGQGGGKAAEMKVKEQEAREREKERIRKHNEEVQEDSRMRFEAHMYSWNREIWLKQQAELRKKEQVRKLTESWERAEKEAAKMREREEKEWKEKLVREASRATALDEEAELKERKGNGPCSTQ
ncbi:golgin subfamily A member 6-like protein 2 [Brachypodium distachyon]|uniref:golgin subfamily A member 6-like protein 2 n=1 Tax=Brachypodium distachyon TaxID=15368 RepID=UPI00071CBA30|nr:golgin subfamily A member 6-like protein 2 [Brachypodium distachyon]|eukprot:XP_014754107.1 golgin subfamily A member 6-like protein 2 [Brachypodium distachyon]